MNLPNAISLSLLVLTAVFIGATLVDATFGPWLALAAFVVAAISDFVDGWLARKLGMVTAMGKLLDTLADKVLVCAAFVYLSEQGLCPVWVTVLIIAREFLVTGLRQIAVEAGQVIAADGWGKWKTAMQLTFCITCLVWLALSRSESQGAVADFFRMLSHPYGWIREPSMWLALGLTLLSGWNYLRASASLLRAK